MDIVIFYNISLCLTGLQNNDEIAKLHYIVKYENYILLIQIGVVWCYKYNIIS